MTNIFNTREKVNRFICFLNYTRLYLPNRNKCALVVNNLFNRGHFKRDEANTFDRKYVNALHRTAEFVFEKIISVFPSDQRSRININMNNNIRIHTHSRRVYEVLYEKRLRTSCVKHIMLAYIILILLRA